MELVSVAAISENRVIGDGEDIPWESLPADRAQYRTRVADEPVILGRRTFELMTDDLPGRAQIVLSRSERDYGIETAHHAGGVDEAVELAGSLGAETAYIIGGAEVYALFQPHLDRMVLTRVPGTYEGDANYPAWDADDWTLVTETAYEGFTVQEWVRDMAAREA